MRCPPAMSQQCLKLANFVFTTTSIILSVVVFVCIDASLSSLGAEPYFGRFAGSFQDLGHNDISGDVYIVNKHAVFFYNFSYDGQGVDVHFKVGVDGEPNHGGMIIADELGRLTHQLNRYTRQNLLLTLPRQVESRDLRWISLWSAAISLSLGHVFIAPETKVPAKSNLGPLVGTLAGAESVIALDDKTLVIRKLQLNPLGNPNWGFYVGSGLSPNVYGLRIPDERGSFGQLRTYASEDIVLRLPRDLSLMYLDWFAIYDPQAKHSAGHVLFERDLVLPPNMAFMLTYVTSFANCETILPNLMQIGWEIRHKDIFIQLEARIASNQYAAFGLSGSRLESKMIGSDVAVAYYDANTNKVMLDDFIILSKSQCNAQARSGVCRDKQLGGRNDLEVLMSSYIDGLIKVTYRRPLRTTDVSNDLSLPTNRRLFVVAAIGTLDKQMMPSYHTVAVNTKFHPNQERPLQSINFGRSQQQRNCDPPLWHQVATQQQQSTTTTNMLNIAAPGSQPAEAEAHNLFEIEPWRPAAIRAENGHVFRVVMGPAGNPQQGYASITGLQPALNRAFWVDDLLIPEIHVTRGHSYTFIIETGDNRTDPTRYHPFYITESREGGGMHRPELLNTPGHRAYAGVDFRHGFANPAPGLGRYCELRESNPTLSYAVHSIEEYRKTLRLQCDYGKIGAFQWRPDANTPDQLYYQCFNHRHLGWKIMVTSSGGTSMTTSWSSLAWFPIVLLSLLCSH